MGRREKRSRLRLLMRSGEGVASEASEAPWRGRKDWT